MIVTSGVQHASLDLNLSGRPTVKLVIFRAGPDLRISMKQYPFLITNGREGLGVLVTHGLSESVLLHDSGSAFESSRGEVFVGVRSSHDEGHSRHSSIRYRFTSFIFRIENKTRLF